MTTNTAPVPAPDPAAQTKETLKQKFLDAAKKAGHVGVISLETAGLIAADVLLAEPGMRFDIETGSAK